MSKIDFGYFKGNFGKNWLHFIPTSGHAGSRQEVDVKFLMNVDKNMSKKCLGLFDWNSDEPTSSDSLAPGLIIKFFKKIGHPWPLFVYTWGLFQTNITN